MISSASSTTSFCSMPNAVRHFAIISPACVGSISKAIAILLASSAYFTSSSTGTPLCAPMAAMLVSSSVVTGICVESSCMASAIS